MEYLAEKLYGNLIVYLKIEETISILRNMLMKSKGNDFRGFLGISVNYMYLHCLIVTKII